MSRSTVFLVLIFLMCIPIAAICQPTGGGPGTPPDVPITGIEVLIAAGGALGLRSLLSRKNKTKD